MLSERIVYSKDLSGNIVRQPYRLFLIGTLNEARTWEKRGVRKGTDLDVLPLGSLDNSQDAQVLSIWTPKLDQIRPLVKRPFGSRWKTLKKLDSSELVASICINDELVAATLELIDDLPIWAKWNILENGRRKIYDGNRKTLEEVLSKPNIMRYSTVSREVIADHFCKASRHFVGIDRSERALTGLNESPLIE